MSLSKFLKELGIPSNAPSKSRSRSETNPDNLSLDISTNGCSNERLIKCGVGRDPTIEADPTKSMRELKHLNGNMLAVVDVETTGLQPFHHSIVQVCVLPLNSDFEMLPGYIPFYMEIQPKYNRFDKEAATVTQLAFEEIKKTGMPPGHAADLFEEWFNKLPLPHNKSLAPLAHNWPFDFCFMLDWLGWHNMQRYFSGH